MLILIDTWDTSVLAVAEAGEGFCIYIFIGYGHLLSSCLAL